MLPFCPSSTEAPFVQPCVPSRGAAVATAAAATAAAAAAAAFRQLQVDKTAADQAQL